MAFASSPLRDPQSFFAPKALDLLVIDLPAFTTGIVLGRSETAPGMVLGVLAQPRPQRRVRVGWCCRGGFIALSAAVLPGYVASEPFADSQYPLEVTNSRPPAFRA